MDDAEDLASLKRLADRQRVAHKEAQVRAVLLQPVTVTEKILRIRMIDALPDTPPPTREPGRARGILLRYERRGNESVNEPTPQAAAPIDDRNRRAERHRRLFSKAPDRAGVWTYMTKEYGSILAFGIDTTTLSRGWFPYTLHVTVELEAFVRRTLKAQVLPVLVRHLPSILKKSWAFLDKVDYNLLVALDDACRLLRAAEVAELSSGWRPYWSALLPVLSALLLFRTSEAWIPRVLKAWDQTAAKFAWDDRTRLEGAESIRTVLEARPDRMTLPDVMQALLMLRTRRALELGALLPQEREEPIATDSFDCTPEVQAEIDKAIEKLAHRLDTLKKEVLELRKLQYFIPREGLLKTFDRGTDRTDLARWCLPFLDYLRDSVRPLLAGTVRFASGESAVLFQNPTLTSAMGRLEELRSLIVESAPGAVAELARELVNLGKILITLIRNRSRFADPLVRSSDPESLTDPLPHEDKVLAKPPEWAGHRVIDALVQLVRVCLSTARFLGDTSLEAELQKEDKLLSRVEEILERVARLAPAALADSMRTEWARVFDTGTLGPEPSVADATRELGDQKPVGPGPPDR